MHDEHRTVSELTQINQRLIRYAFIIMITALTVNLLSSYIRHTEAGLGCNDWPGCYATIDLERTESHQTSNALLPSHGAKQLHRVLAVTLLVLIVLLVREQRKAIAAGVARHKTPKILLSIVILLAVVGPLSYLKTYPLIASINILGGISLFIVSFGYWISLIRGSGGNSSQMLHWLARIALLMTLFMLVSGSWVSANFAATSCTEVISCQAATQVSPGMQGGLGPFRELATDQQGHILIDEYMALIHQVHHIAAVVLSVCLLLLGAMSLGEGGRLSRSGLTIMSLLFIEIGLGLTSLYLQLPLVLVLAHYLFASLLLASVVEINLLLQKKMSDQEVLNESLATN